MSKEKQSLITDINEARDERENENQKDKMMEELENTDFEINEDESIFDQYASLHGGLLTRVLKKIKLSGGNVGKEDANYLAHTIQNVLQQEVMFGLMEYLEVENIKDIVSEEKQDEIVSMFDMKQNLDVSPEDLEALKSQMENN